MKITPVSLLFTASFITTTATSANNDVSNESFFEFLAEIEEIDNTLAHPVDFSDEDEDLEYTTGTSND